MQEHREALRAQLARAVERQVRAAEEEAREAEKMADTAERLARLAAEDTRREKAALAELEGKKGEEKGEGQPAPQTRMVTRGWLLFGLLLGASAPFSFSFFLSFFFFLELKSPFLHGCCLCISIIG